MKSFKYILFAFSALFAAACSEDEFQPGAPAVEGSENVVFSADNESNMVLSLTASEIELTLVREDGSKKVEVPIQFSSSYEGIFVAPKTVTFEAGETEATYAIALTDNMKPFLSYSFQVSVPEEYGNPYINDEESSSFPRMEVTVLKEDYRVVAEGIYSDPVLFKDQWNQDLEYSDIKGLYRLSDVFAANSAIYFFYDGENFYFTDKDGRKTESIFSGYTHATYGRIMMNIKTDYPMGYDSEVDMEGAEGEFYFVCSFDVSAGSFGTNYEEYYILNWLEKPWEKPHTEE